MKLALNSPILFPGFMMMVDKIKKIMFATGVCFLLAIVCGCTSALRVVILNNTNDVLSIKIKDRFVTINNGSKVELILSGYLYDSLIESRDRRFIYSWIHPGAENLEVSGLHKRFCVQVEPSLDAFLIHGGVMVSPDKLPHQPAGYPLQPRFQKTD